MRTCSLLGALFLSCLSGCATTHFSLECTRCGQHAGREQSTFAGLTTAQSTCLTGATGDIMDPASLGPQIPHSDAYLYERIFGDACNHQFLTVGFCRKQNGTIACGASLEIAGHRPRLSAIAATYRVFEIIPDSTLARQTFGLIDRILALPLTDDGYAAVEASRKVRQQLSERAAIFVSRLNTIHSTSDWRAVLLSLESTD